MTVRVNGEPIPDAAIEHEFNRLVKFYSEHMSPEQIKAQLPILKQKAKDQAVGAKLLLQRATGMDLKVPEDYVAKRLEEIAAQAGGMPRFREILRKQGLSEKSIRDSIIQGRKVDLLIERITDGLNDPTEAEMEAHFKAHEAEYAKAERAQVQHILIKPASPKFEDKAVARSRLLEIKQQIEDGADFLAMAAAHSECPSGRKSGGSLGWISRGSMIPELDQAVFSMEVDELSDAVETELGFHLLRKTAHEEGGDVTFLEVRDRVRDFLRHVKRGEAIGAFVAELREKAVIEEDGSG